MAVAKININTDAETKEQAQALFQALGMDMTTGINIYLKRVVLEKGIPFDLSLKTPNAETLAAFAEFEAMKNDPVAYKRYSSMDELREALEA